MWKIKRFDLKPKQAHINTVSKVQILSLLEDILVFLKLVAHWFQ